MNRCIYVVLTVLFILLPAAAWTQDSAPSEPSTKLEEFLSKKGVIFIKEFHDAGTPKCRFGGSISVNAIIIYEPSREAEAIRGLKIEISKGGTLDRSDTSFLDLEEVQSLLDALDYMISVSQKWEGTEQEYTEVIFTTKSGFRIGFYQKGHDFTGFASSGLISRVHGFFPIEDLPDIKEVIDNGWALLQQ